MSVKILCCLMFVFAAIGAPMTAFCADALPAASVKVLLAVPLEEQSSEVLVYHLQYAMADMGQNDKSKNEATKGEIRELVPVLERRLPALPVEKTEVEIDFAGTVLDVVQVHQSAVRKLIADARQMTDVKAKP